MGKTTKKIITIIGILLGTILFISFELAQGDKYPDGSYVRGRHGKYCYSAEGKPKTVHDPISFDSLKECLASFK